MSGARLVANDPALPQLAQALDVSALRTCFTDQVIGAPGWRVQRCHIERAKYRPGRSVLIGYRLELHHAATGVMQTQRVCAALYSAREADERARAAARKSYLNAGPVKPFAHVAQLAMLVWAFPNDRKLHALAMIADADRMAAALRASIVAARWGEQARVAEIGHVIVSYFPEHTCTAKLSVAVDVGGMRQQWQVFAKTRYDDVGARTKRIMDALSASRAACANEVGYARALAYDSNWRMLWQEGVAAPTLHDRIVQGATSARVMARVGAALAALHTTAIADQASAGVLQPGAGALRLRGAHATLAASRPRSALSLERCVERLLALAPEQDHERGLIHGDLHSKNILVSADQVSFIDLDRVGYGSPLAELGALIAELHHRALQRHSDPAEPIAALCAAYQARARWRVAPSALAWHVAGALICERALRCVTSLKPGAAEDIEKLIMLAEALAHEAGSVRTRHVHANQFPQAR